MRKIPKVYKDKYFIVLGVIVLLSFFINFRNILFQTSFGYDQARDAYEAYSILPQLNVKILGPSTDIPGVNHGVLWYYALSIPYFLSGQDPHGVGLIYYLLAYISVPFVWVLAQELFGNRKISFLAVVLYSFSPFFVAFSNWLSNPILSLYISPLLLLFLWRYLTKVDTRYAILMGVFFGLLIQSNLSFMLFLLLLPLYLMVFRVKPRVHDLAGFFTALFVTLSSYLLVELRFGWRGVAAVLKFLQEDHAGSSNKVYETLIKISELFQLSVFPFDNLVVYLITLTLFASIIYTFKNNKKPLAFLLIWLSNIALFKFFSTGISQSSFVFLPTVGAVIILTSYGLVTVFKRWFFLSTLLVVLVVSYSYQNLSWHRDEFSPATIQKSNTVYRYKQAVDYTYMNSNNERFTIVTVTNPLFVNTTWAYLYEFYGAKKYGYEPFYAGRSQKGYLGNLEEKQFGGKLRFLIIESTIGIPDVYVTKAQYEEDKVSDVIDEIFYGHVRVQKRIFHPNKPEIDIPDTLKNSHVLYD